MVVERVNNSTHLTFFSLKNIEKTPTKPIMRKNAYLNLFKKPNFFKPNRGRQTSEILHT